jgi:very-short-patch-repair endonuclease/DNA polymerase III delta prime subunit
MSETILNKLEASRKELLDLGLRNPLLNYKVPASRGLQIIEERSTPVYELLVRQQKAMSFLSKPIKETRQPAREQTKNGATLELFPEPAVNVLPEHEVVILPENSTQPFTETNLPAQEANTVTEEVAAASYTDTKLQTNETDDHLQRRLLNTYYDARTSIEEQGINILYLSLGMLHWYEAANSQELRKAPLVLVPVTLDRSSVRERFRLRYTLEEMGANISLQAKMKAEFGILIPDMPEPEDFDISEYFNAIEKAIDKAPRWKVEPNEIELGFFSFGKFMIYNDLDSNKWPTDKKPAQHPIVINLFEQGFGHESIGIPEEAHIDEDTNAHELFQVVDADSSQLLAMLAVNDGKNLVIQGPPGTGKSQTITNIIANAIGQGKKVLFVAEKMAALEVVKRRLDNIHLGEACLELHSHKANKKELHQELRRVLELGKPALQQLQQQVVLLEAQKEELNAYCYAINTPIANSGLTPHQVIGHLLQIKDLSANQSIQNIPLEDIEQWDATRMTRAEAFSNRIQARLKEIGMPSNLLFWGSRLLVLLPNDQEALVKQLQQATGTTQEAEATAAQPAQHIGLTIPASYDEATSLVSILKLLSLKPDLEGFSIKHKRWLLDQAAIEALLETGKRLASLREQYKDIFIPEAWQQEVMEIRQNLLAHGDKWYKFMIGAYGRSNKQLAALCKTPLPSENSSKLQYVDAILENKRLETSLQEYDTLAAELFGRRWQKVKSDWTALETANRYLLIVHKQVAAGYCPPIVLDYLEKHEDPAIAKTFHDQLVPKLEQHKHAIQQVVAQLVLDEARRFGSKGLLQQTFAAQTTLLQDWHQGITAIHQAISWNNLEETGATENLQSLIHTASHWPPAKDLLTIAMQKTWYEYLFQQAITAHPVLRKFERASHEEVVQQFRNTDKLNLQFNRARAAAQHWENMPRLEAGGQVNTLRTEFNKKSRHKPIRKLVEEAGLAIQAIKPVFMMSPLSIANFLPPGSVEFDIVIFDEASQVRPVEALGAIMRGKQVVVVGDTKQLPPTSFFDSLTNEVDEEDNVTADLPSILGMCDAQGAPQRMLRWHYRSRHESLIMLSNHEFYVNKLVIFPSPGSKQKMGLVFHHLKDTIYDRGKTRTNPKEAEIVAEAVLEHARKSPRLSLGVASFSSAQRQAIQDALETRRRKHPELEHFFNAHADEPFFVKNLENVQGDERDVIFISIGYGRSAEGNVSMSFGPLNNEGGERRLNVLITRAKLRCEVFTNITADDIDLSRTQKYSIQTLKSFLHFAQHGKLYVPGSVAGLPADSPFEEMVAAKLAVLGYTVRTQVGSQGYYLDLAIVDEHNPGRYILGIECDGAAYHAARSARDRDRLRQQVLEAIGWRIYRVWSTDWFRDPDRELKRLVAAIEQAKEGQHIEDADEEEPVEPIALEREELPEPMMDMPDYVFAKVPAEIASQEIHLHSMTKLAIWIEEIVKVESPVHFDEVARRMIEAAGITRIGSRIRDALQQAVKYAEGNKWIRVSEDFLWHREMKIPILRDRSNLPPAVKKLKYIAPEEMIGAIEKVVRASIAIQPDAAVPLVARLFGFARVTEEMKAEIIGMIGRCLHQQHIYQEGGFLKPVN